MPKKTVRMTHRHLRHITTTTAQNCANSCFIAAAIMVLLIAMIFAAGVRSSSDMDHGSDTAQMESPKISWPNPDHHRDRRQVGLGSLSHDGSHSGDHGDQRSNSISVSDGSSVSSPNRNKDELAPRQRLYPQRNYDQPYQQQGRSRNAAALTNDPASTFRQQSRQQQHDSFSRKNSGGSSFPYDPHGPPSRHNNGSSSYSNSQGRSIQTQRHSKDTTTKRPANLKNKSGGQAATRSPFDDPDRYRVPQLQQAADNVRFVNGRPYR